MFVKTSIPVSYTHLVAGRSSDYGVLISKLREMVVQGVVVNAYHDHQQRGYAEYCEHYAGGERDVLTLVRAYAAQRHAVYRQSARRA